MYVCMYVFIYFRGEGREGEKYQCMVAFHTPPSRDLTWPTTQARALTGS